MQKNSAREMENEVRMYWRLSRTLHRGSADFVGVIDIAEELDVLRRYTNWPALRASITKCMVDNGLESVATCVS